MYVGPCMSTPDSEWDSPTAIRGVHSTAASVR